jgi:Hypothetical protein (DUF2513)
VPEVYHRVNRTDKEARRDGPNDRIRLNGCNRVNSGRSRGTLMKRDMDLIRTILLKVEESTSLGGCQIEIPDRSPEEVYYNARQAQDAGLIEARFAPLSTDFHVFRLTFAGHEFLDAARNDTQWAKAKNTVIEKTGTLTLEALKIALTMLIKQALGG